MTASETIFNHRNPPSHVTSHPKSLVPFNDDALQSGACPGVSLLFGASEPLRILRPNFWTDKALNIPEIVYSIQEQLDRATLNRSLLVSRLWYLSGHPLVWQTVDWDNTLEGSFQEEVMRRYAYRIETMRCTFHSQGGTSKVDSSSLLREFVVNTNEEGLSIHRALSSSDDDGDDTMAKSLPARGRKFDKDGILIPTSLVRPRMRLKQLSLKGHFDLQSTEALHSSFSNLGLAMPVYITFNIPTLTRLDIHPSVDAAVDIHLILDWANNLQHLIIRSHGSFTNSRGSQLAEDEAVDSVELGFRNTAHTSLVSLTIQHLKISREELESVMGRCPSLLEFQSVCSPGTLWKARPPPLQFVPQHSQQLQQQQQGLIEHASGPTVTPTPQQKSLVRTLSELCPDIQRFHIGLQQGGFHADSIRETLRSFPRLGSLGLPAWDCTKVTIEAIKAFQMEQQQPPLSPLKTRSGGFLTTICIMNVCSSEKVSQAIHEYLCWTPYLKEFCAYNTTLYVEQMQQEGEQQQEAGEVGEVVEQDAVNSVDARSACLPPSSTDYSDPQHRPSTSIASPSSFPIGSVTSSSRQPARKWACASLETLVVRFAHLPWRNLSDPPKRSKDTFAFLKPLQSLKRLCIKEGLMLEAGREYEALAELRSLEEVVFTTCYPIPIKPKDLVWMVRGGQGKDPLRRVVVRKQKANVELDKEMRGWFSEQRPEVRFEFELTDCCEEEYSFR
ncbi:hypothetical protein BC939DRAFT_499887 [Gamsiella multidivaricata]|uniref:uncharacterized protein n=1 Tax=Gamsiella multidivaricata TaxID=101098 RepID=UPI002220CAF8|nr:uncharacterized protein BC939DRAFT_499887 [Gamsiella multidivaricata]KAG0356445.1 hypothetical protein BGZ54_000726 [Gamsiella multidivaricata]KAI7829764.1 hypothetical protein BC939DRAFT_499887 [Gamsiella multidivaricata]